MALTIVSFILKTTYSLENVFLNLLKDDLLLQQFEAVCLVCFYHIIWNSPLIADAIISNTYT